MPSRPKQVVILTTQEDLHALAVRQELQSLGVECSIVETDTFAGSGGLNWFGDAANHQGVLPDLFGKLINVSEVNVIWWRRANGTPKFPETLKDEAARDVVENDCRATMLGILSTSFQGVWVSRPEATRQAELKPVQLRAGSLAGLRVPRTLISQNPEAIRSFFHELKGQVIVKTVAGSHKSALPAGMVTERMLKTESMLSLSPAIYQEYIPGDIHLRVQIFGTQIISASIKSPNLDWRLRLDQAKVEPFQLPASLEPQLHRLLKILQLRMGIVDFKVTPEGEIVWLEINPQGQFLFIEGLTKLKLAAAFATFLAEEAETSLRSSLSEQCQARSLE